MKLTEEQIKFLDRVCGGTWTLNSKSEVDVKGNVNMVNMKLTQIPVKFGSVSISFDCSHNQLTSLEGCPSKVDGHFDCSNNQLTSLNLAPTSVGGYFWCRYNQLTDYFKNIKEEDFPYWNNLYWYYLLGEYPFLINTTKKYLKDETLKRYLTTYPQTKLYLE